MRTDPMTVDAHPCTMSFSGVRCTGTARKCPDTRFVCDTCKWSWTAQGLPAGYDARGQT